MRDKDGRPLYVVTPHPLRHFHAVRALDLGIPLKDLQAQLGHTDLKTTSVYLKADINTPEEELRGIGYIEINERGGANANASFFYPCTKLFHRIGCKCLGGG